MTDHTSGPTGQDADSPNPFSREGGTPAEQPGTDAATGSATGSDGSGQPGQASGATALPAAGQEQPTDPYAYQPPSQPAAGSWGGSGDTQPYGQPSANAPYGQPSANPPYSQPSANAPYGQPSANPPYEQPGGSYGQPGTDPYGQPGANAYGQPGGDQPWNQPSANPPYEQPPGYQQQPGAYGTAPQQPGAYGQPGYDQSGYGVSPYQGGYGYPAYGAGAVQHPQAVVALITGIVGLVLCGPVGIAGIINGRKVRNEIDADPQRYTGRGMGTAGLVLGIVGLVLFVLWVLLIVIGYASSN